MVPAEAKDMGSREPAQCSWPPGAGDPAKDGDSPRRRPREQHRLVNNTGRQVITQKANSLPDIDTHEADQNTDNPAERATPRTEGGICEKLHTEGRPAGGDTLEGVAKGLCGGGPGPEVQRGFLRTDSGGLTQGRGRVSRGL